jgi:hypothetical protein
MKFTGKTLAEEEWKKIYGDWPSDSDFAWPFFRDAFDAGKKSTKTENQSFYEILRSKFLFSSEIADDILNEFDVWLSSIRTTSQSDDRISVSLIRKKLKKNQNL